MEVVKDFYKQIPTLTSFQFRDKVTQLTEVFKQDGKASSWHSHTHNTEELIVTPD